MDVLVVEDAPTISHLVEGILTKNRHQVRCVDTVAAAHQELGRRQPDLIVLDLGLPDGDGIDFCVSIRPHSDAYILMLSGRTDEVDKITGLRCGADDYMGKPLLPREFEARIAAIARRFDKRDRHYVVPRQPRDAEEDEAEVDTFSHQAVILDSGRRTVVADDQPVELTRVEFDLLAMLIENPSRVYTRAQIIERVWGYDYVGQDHVLDVHIGNLRRKLRAVGVDGFVRTVRGVGYGLALEAA
ncbi:MAG: response regulator transcription factor [Acidimicrobiales bacterium]